MIGTMHDLIWEPILQENKEDEFFLSQEIYSTWLWVVHDQPLSADKETRQQSIACH